MGDMRLTVLATILLTIIFMGELQRCIGQVHYKQPGWGPGGKRSSDMTGRNGLRKRYWRLESQPSREYNPEKQLNLARYLAKKLNIARGQ